MLDKSKKLNNRDFHKNSRKRKKARSKFFSLQLEIVQEDVPSRVAVIVSKKVARKAVWRNEIKRKVYLLIKEYYPQISRSLIVKVIVLKDLRSIDTNSLREDLSLVLGINKYNSK